MPEREPRPGFHSVTPRMVVRDVAVEVEFLRAVFGATGHVPEGRPAEVRIGDSLVYVANVDRAYQRAMAEGAVSEEEPRDTPYGDRRAMVRDSSGNVFQIARVQS